MAFVPSVSDDGIKCCDNTFSYLYHCLILFTAQRHRMHLRQRRRAIIIWLSRKTSCPTFSLISDHGLTSRWASKHTTAHTRKLPTWRRNLNPMKRDIRATSYQGPPPKKRYEFNWIRSDGKTLAPPVIKPQRLLLCYLGTRSPAADDICLL